MADLFDPPSPPPAATAGNFSVDSDDISSLLHTLLHNSSTSCAPPSSEDRRIFAGSAGFSHQSGPLDSNFRFAGGFYSSDRAENGFSGSIGLSMEGIGELECESEEQEDNPMNPRPARGSSKRSRAAEVHNLSEKRRRQKINEKMKALQKLIPNSNKTDKASMLDEAIEYLKQLQLQVQMLTLRNGSSLHPFYLPGVSHPVQPPQVGPLLDEPNSSRGGGSFPGNQEASVQAMFDLSSKPNSSDYKLLMPRMSDNSNSGLPFVMEPSTNAYYRPFNASMSSKALCKDPVLPQLQLEMSQGQSSSSGVSS